MTVNVNHTNNHFLKKKIKETHAIPATKTTNSYDEARLKHDSGDDNSQSFPHTTKLRQGRHLFPSPPLPHLFLR